VAPVCRAACPRRRRYPPAPSLRRRPRPARLP
jgi:hypothetical protein